MKKRHTEHGSFLFFAGGVLLPCLLLCAGFAITELKRNMSQAALQQALDRAALLAAKKLPFENAARQTAAHVLNSAGLLPDRSTIRVHASRVSITYATSSTTILGLLSKTHAQATHSIAARAEALINPQDIVIFVDASSYLAPTPGNALDYSWNETTAEIRDRLESAEEYDLRTARTQWPTAQFFRRNRSHFVLEGRPVHPRVLTQQCFNSAFSPLKEAAIRMYDYFVRNPDNSVGVVAGPGSAEEVTTIRNLLPAHARNPSPGEGRFDYYRSARNIARDESCLQAAKAEIRHTGYTVPPPGNPAIWGPARLLDAPRSGLSLDYSAVPGSYITQLSVRDIIWSLAARRNYEGTRPVPRTVDFVAVLRRVSEMLLHAPYRPERGDANQALSRIGILMMGDIPHVRGVRLAGPGFAGSGRMPSHAVHRAARQILRAELIALGRRVQQAGVTLQLYVSVTKHLGIYPPERYPTCVTRRDDGSASRCEQFLFDTRAFEALVNETTGSIVTSESNTADSPLQIQLLRSPDTEALATALPSWLPLLDRTVLTIRK